MLLKESKYNYYIEHDGKSLVFNGVTSAFAEIDEDYMNVIEQIKNNIEIKDEEVSELVKEMIDGGFVVEKDFDEFKYLKLGNYSSKFSSDEFGLTIAPTLACNFACPYCYECPTPDFMSKETMESIIQLVEKMARKRKNIGITWYGGEPMLAEKCISKMSERMIAICQKNDVNYDAYMVSNGYLITKENVKRIKENKIYGVQLTIDGPPEIHNLRRKLKAREEDTFFKIIETAQLLKKEDIQVHIRINVDKTNEKYLEDLIDLLKKYGLEDCSVNLGHVKAYTNACASVIDSCMNTKEFAELSLKTQKLMYQKGFRATTYPYYPGTKGNYCCADSASAFVVDPKGYLYKCWNDIGNEKRTVGHVADFENVSESNQIVNMNYLLWSPFEFKQCRECKMLPICMGGCPYIGLKENKKPECENWKYTLKDVLIAVYEQSKQLITKEGSEII